MLSQLKSCAHVAASCKQPLALASGSVPQARCFTKLTSSPSNGCSATDGFVLPCQPTHDVAKRCVEPAGFSGRRGSAVICAAAAGGNQASVPPVQVPDSQQKAVDEAARVLKLHMQPLIGGATPKKAPAKAKGFSAKAAAPAKRQATHFAVEIPVADSGAASTAALAASLAGALAGSKLGALTMVFADPAAASEAAKKLPQGVAKALSLQEACRQDRLAGVLLLVGPKVADVALVEQLLEEVWSGPTAALLNAEFLSGPVPPQHQGVVDGILVVWSFLPIALAGLLGGKEGAVMRVVDKPGPSADDTTWRILYKQGDGSFTPCGQTKRRPKSDDLELAFMNATAAMSPITNTVKAVKNLIPGFGGQKKK